jgi:O-antigen/teichoic acid export membrane protein
MRAVLSRWLLVEDLVRFSLVTHAAGAVLNVALNLVLIPRYGGLGAAAATVASYATASWGALFFATRTRPIGIMMAKSLLLPLRFADLGRYARRLGMGRGAASDR